MYGYRYAREFDENVRVLRCRCLDQTRKHTIPHGEVEYHNGVHLLRYALIGDGKRRNMEEVFRDSEWCKAVADFLV